MNKYFTLNLIFILFIVVIIFSCSDTQDNPSKNLIESKSNNRNLNEVEKSLFVCPQTKLDTWGGDGKWHAMSEIDGKYWVNYEDPFQILLVGSYQGLTVIVTASNGDVIYKKSDINISGETPFLVQDNLFHGKYDENYNVSIIEENKLIYEAEIMSIPGGE
jgi:hypothetical protein